MIVVHTPSDTYEVRFSHPTRKIVLPGAAKLTIENRFSICDIYLVKPSPMFKMSTYVLAASGKAKCHIADQFNKETGRKLALARALKDSKLGKADRYRFWVAYQRRNILPKPAETKTTTKVQNHSLTVH